MVERIVVSEGLKGEGPVMRRGKPVAIATAQKGKEVEANVKTWSMLFSPEVTER